MKQFIMLVGLPGSGKSIVRHELTKIYDAKNRPYQVLCPHKMRKALTGNALDLEREDDIKKMCKDKIHNWLTESSTVFSNDVLIYEASNIDVFTRRELLDLMSRTVIKKAAIYMDKSFAYCIQNNLKRDFDERVPDFVMSKLAHQIQQPIKQEGFNDIISITYDIKIYSDRFIRDIEKIR